jgi:hypothetical protein
LKELASVNAKTGVVGFVDDIGHHAEDDRFLFFPGHNRFIERFSDRSFITQPRLYRPWHPFPIHISYDDIGGLGLNGAVDDQCGATEVLAPAVKSPSTLKNNMAGGLATRLSFRSRVFCS